MAHAVPALSAAPTQANLREVGVLPASSNGARRSEPASPLNKEPNSNVKSYKPMVIHFNNLDKQLHSVIVINYITTVTFHYVKRMQSYVKRMHIPTI